MKGRVYTKDIIKQKGKEVILAGWVLSRRDHGKLIFLDLKDAQGVVQLVISEKNNKQVYDNAQNIRDGWVILARGKVQKRPDNMKNSEIETGEFEVPVSHLEILNEAKTLPFGVADDGYEILEELRLKYRYLDLERPRMQKNMRLKQDFKLGIINFLTSQGFLHIDTPILTKSTPEGARDFLVPSRNYPGTFYALPQSPQQYKQLLMVTRFEKYFQFAKCFRDEDLRQDRLLEFEQLDIEMSFISEEEILNLTEELVIHVTEKILGKKIQEKPFPRITYDDVIKKYKTDKPDLRKTKDENTMAYLWIIDFPMFEKNKDGSISPSHHPFTAINEADISKLSDKKKIFEIRARQYDLVLNGQEIFGGSIRTHNSEILTKVFNALGYSLQEVQKKFSHLLEAFKYGAPPHGGIAAGSDRWLATMLGEKSIREVVAFPTTGTGHTSIMDAPSKVDDKQLKELGLSLIKKIK